MDAGKAVGDVEGEPVLAALDVLCDTLGHVRSSQVGQTDMRLGYARRRVFGLRVEFTGG